jgi:signal transduction histidine kinase
MALSMTHHGPSTVRAVPDGLNFNTVFHECLACGVILANDAGRITLLNPEAGDLVGLKPDDSTPASVDALPTVLRALLAEAFLKGCPEGTQEIAIQDRTGLEHTLRVTTLLKAAEPGQSREVVVLLHDLTASRTIESNMRWLDRLASLGTLSAGMAHEVRNALVAIKTFVELGCKQVELAPMGDLVGREIRRIEAILSEMLRFAGPPKVSFAPLHVHEVLEHAVEVVRPQLEDRAIRLRCNLAAGSDFVRGDEHQLEQSFLNLLLNAIDSMGSQGHLSVSTRISSPDTTPPGSDPAPPALRVEIGDNGVGIAAEHLERLFEPFFSTKPGGTGLGLAISRRIIEEHHGEVTVQSEVGRGTVFSITLPLILKSE